jgi:putative intracellular protease/amidase
VKIALFVYDGFTALDIIGPYEVLAVYRTRISCSSVNNAAP